MEPIAIKLLEEAMIGSVLSGRYEITEMIGKGSTTTVYQGVDHELVRAVAIKVIHPDISADPSFAQHFLIEGQYVATLSHPNIVSIYHLGEDNGTQYIVQELVWGKTLREILADGPLPIERALDYAKQLASGLAAAHELGIVHWDIKPENILLTDGGVAKLADFGISRARVSTGKVTEGIIVGTLDYLAPEQIDGKKPDEKSDIYSLGLVIYEMLAGRLPFDQAQITLAQRLAMDPKPLLEANPNVTIGLSQVVMEALARNPSARHRSAIMLAESLASFDSNGSRELVGTLFHKAPPIVITELAEQRPNAWLKLRRKTVVASGSVILAITVFVAAATWTASGSQPPSTPAPTALGIRTLVQPLVAMTVTPIDLSFSPATPSITRIEVLAPNEPAVSSTPAATNTAVPLPTASPTPYVVRTFGQLDEAGTTLEVQQWSDGHFTSKIVANAAAATSPTETPSNELQGDLPFVTPTETPLSAPLAGLPSIAPTAIPQSAPQASQPSVAPTASVVNANPNQGQNGKTSPSQGGGKTNSNGRSHQ